MKKLTQVGVLGAFCAVSGMAFAAPLTLSNQGFESGLANWISTGHVTSTGSTTVTTYDPPPGGTTWSVYPFQTTMAHLVSNNGVDLSSNISALDSFFGLPAGTINSFVPPAYPGSPIPAYNGSGIKQSFSGNAGDVLTQYWNFFSTEDRSYDYGDGTHPDDTAFVVVTGPGAPTFTVLASTPSVGAPGTSGWQAFSYTLPAAGNYTIGFGVVNWRDEYFDAELFVDDGTRTIPEPASAALLGLALAGLGWSRRKRV